MKDDSVLTLTLKLNGQDNLKIIACWQEMHSCIEQFAKWLRDKEKYGSENPIAIEDVREAFLQIRREEGILDIFDY